MNQVKKAVSVYKQVCTAIDDQVDVVINYFNPKHDSQLMLMTLQCVRTYLSAPLCHVILSDGSGFKEEKLQRCSEAEGFDYLWSDRPISFSETYNRGIEHSEKRSSVYICLSANDVFVEPSTVQLILAELKADESVGCVIPYLSWSDFMIQNDRWLKRRRYTYGMSLNLNLFRTKELVAIGKVPIKLSGCFNDFVMAAAIREVGKKILLCNGGKITHLTKMTVSVASSVNYHEDKEILKRLYPALISKNPAVYMRISSLCKVNVPLKLYYLILDNCSYPILSKAFFVAGRLAMRIEKFAWQVIFSWWPAKSKRTAEDFLLRFF